MKMFLFLIISIFLWRELYVKWPDKLLHLVVCDVGQGDAILFSYMGQQILIDAGPNDKIINCLNDKMPFWDKKIDILILTHYDEDHIGGFKHVAQSYEIGYVFLPLTDYKESKTFLELQERLLAMQELGLKIKQPFLGQQISLVEFKPEYQAKYNSMLTLDLTFLTPFVLDAEQYVLLEENQRFAWQNTETYLSAAEWQKTATLESNNNGSIATFIQFGELKILLTGDLELPREVALIERSLIGRVDVQKAGHHGSKTASGLDFLEATRPEMGLISCGLNNKFSHPHPEVLSNFAATLTKIVRTDELGTIEILSDGQKFWLKDEKQNLLWKK